MLYIQEVSYFLHFTQDSAITALSMKNLEMLFEKIRFSLTKEIEVILEILFTSLKTSGSYRTPLLRILGTPKGQKSIESLLRNNDNKGIHQWGLSILEHLAWLEHFDFPLIVDFNGLLAMTKEMYPSSFFFANMKFL